MRIREVIGGKLEYKKRDYAVGWLVGSFLVYQSSYFESKRYHFDYDTILLVPNTDTVPMWELF
jgi:hypothetical protein